jgi:PAS domain S-box-containing protein
MEDTFNKRISQISETGKGAEYEDVLEIPSGDKRWFRSNLQPVKDISGKTYAILTISYDITAHKIVDERISKERDKAQNYLNIAGVIIVAIDANQNITLINKKGSEVLGYSQIEIIGKNWFDNFVPYRDRELVKSVFTKLMAGELEPVEYFENPVLIKNGNERIIAWRNSLLYDEEGRIIGTLSSGEDITEQERMAKELEQAIDELKRSNAELEQFAYTASHDLKEPLLSLACNLKLIERRYRAKLGNETDEFITDAINQASQMQTLITNLLEYAHVDTYYRPLKMVDCSVMLNRTLENLKTTLEDSGAVVTHDSLPRVMADPIQFVQLLQNLIVNAIKFRGSDAPRIHISVERKEQKLVFAVSDNGIGIPAEQVEHIFKIFQSFHKMKNGGLGMGLAICKKIVERHGGHIWVTSEPGKGSIFYFNIPERELTGPTKDCRLQLPIITDDQDRFLSK